MLRAVWMIFACLVPALAAHAADSVTGTYKMKNGQVLVQQIEGRVRFNLNATWKTTVGEVSGEVPLEGNAASFPDEDADCKLTFKFAGGKLVVSQDSTCGMGLNVSGNGTYKRISTASPKLDE